MKKSYLTVALGLSFSVGAGGEWSWRRFEKQTTVEVARDHSLPSFSRSSDAATITVKSTRKSYFALDTNGAPIPEIRDGKHYSKVEQRSYEFQRAIATNRTALIVMDPWEDSGSSFLTRYYERIILTKILPLIRKAMEMNIPVLVLTNSPRDADYGSRVHPAITNLAEPGKLHIIHHQDTDSERFSAGLRKMSIDTLIYSGFASNTCVIGRDLGMIPMQIKGFRLFFIPEASAAVESEDSWESGSTHKATVSLISLWVGELISLEDFLAVRPSSTR